MSKKRHNNDGADDVSTVGLRFVAGERDFWCELELPPRRLTSDEVSHLGVIVRVVTGECDSRLTRMIRDAIASATDRYPELNSLLDSLYSADGPAITPLMWAGED